MKTKKRLDKKASYEKSRIAHRAGWPLTGMNLSGLAKNREMKK